MDSILENEHKQMFIRMDSLIKFCDERKVYYRSQDNRKEEIFFSDLEFKANIMCENSKYYFFVSLETKHQEVVDIYNKKRYLVDMKIDEEQNKTYTHYISVIESYLRSNLINNNVVRKDNVKLNEIIEYLYKNNVINKNQKHLWDGIRQMRNAIVHYNSISRINADYYFYNGLSISIKKGKLIVREDLYEHLKLMEWMTFEVNKIIEITIGNQV